MENFKERFKGFNTPGYVSLISKDAKIPLYIGIDDNNRYIVELRGKFTPRKMTSTSAIEVSQYKKPEYNTLRFALTNEDVSGLFFIFCEDLVEQIEGLYDVAQGYLIICNRFTQWKQMFVSSNKKKLTELEIIGLISEILFLRGWMNERYGLSEALKSWSGQELTHKDFSIGNSWYEVKGVSRGKPTVRISSLEQLDSETDGELVIFPIEKMSEEFKGITLNSLVIETAKLFSDPEEVESFRRKVAMQGYEYSNYYDSFVYAVDEPKRFCVTQGFPRLVRGDVSASIVSCIYDILIKDLEKFEVRE